jgi:hypothetical protein
MKDYDDILALAEITYKNLTNEGLTPEECGAVMTIVNVLLNYDAVKIQLMRGE